MRQAGYLTTLSGAFGYTLGVGHLTDPVKGIFPWKDALLCLDTPSAKQMGYLRTVFYNRPWKDLRPQHCNPPTASCGNLIPKLGNCDWVLLLQDTCPTCLSSSATGFSEASLQVWQGHDEGTMAGIHARAVTAGGQPLNREILATSGMPGAHKLPQVARERSGTSLVVWQSDGLDGSLWGIWARRFNPTGEPLGDAFQVNTYTDHDQSDPAVASIVGDFVVAWTSYGQDGDRGGIFVQRVGASGRLVGEEIAVNTQTEGHQGFPQVGADASGNFAIAWESQEGDQRSIYLQRFDRQGLRLGREELVASSSEGLRELVSLAVDPLGDLTVQWQSYDGQGGNLGRYQRRFHSDGSPSGEAALVPWSAAGL